MRESAFLETDYSLDLSKVDRSSNPAIIGMALPYHKNLIAETETYVIERFDEVDLNRTENYPRTSIVPDEA